MTNYNQNYNNLPMVNYTSVLTPAANEIYLTQTDLPDSLAFMIKNKVVISFDLNAEAEQVEKDKGASTACESIEIKSYYSFNGLL